MAGPELAAGLATGLIIGGLLAALRCYEPYPRYGDPDRLWQLWLVGLLLLTVSFVRTDQRNVSGRDGRPHYCQIIGVSSAGGTDHTESSS